jgi:hypothetical protein
MKKEKRDIKTPDYRFGESTYNRAIDNADRGYFYFKDLPPQFIDLLTQKGMSIVEIGCGCAELAPGLRIYLTEDLRVDIPVLCTDIWNFKHLSDATVIDEFFARYPEKIMRKYRQLNTQVWQTARRGLYEEEGEDWDATSPDFYDKALAKLVSVDERVKKAGLWIRQPEISDDKQEPTFRKIIANMVAAVDIHQVPIIVATSSKIASVERSLSVITGTLNERDFKEVSQLTEEIEAGDEAYKKRTTQVYGRSGDSKRVTLIIEDTIDASKVARTREKCMELHISDLYFGSKDRIDFRAYLLMP